MQLGWWQETLCGLDLETLSSLWYAKRSYKFTKYLASLNSTDTVKKGREVEEKTRQSYFLPPTILSPLTPILSAMSSTMHLMHPN